MKGWTPVAARRIEPDPELSRVVWALQEAGSVPKAAAILGLTTSQLWRRMQILGLASPRARKRKH